jgi:hypothetical protein
LNPTRGIKSIPLLEQLFQDPHIQVVARGIDKNWLYHEVIRLSASGFNPFQRKVYLGKNSAAWEWIQKGMKNDRLHNEGDILMREILFTIHDYLHAWACLVIQNEMPELGFGSAEITHKNFEDFVFCHLLTEAVATVGLDYWYLSTIDLAEVTQTGTLVKVLTVGYHENNRSEYLRFNPDFEAQTPEFFSRIATFYCNGEFEGFALNDIKRSPKLKAWLQHELSYGELQRKYTREWFSYLSNGKVTVPKTKLTNAILVNRPWQKKLIKTMGQLLWDKVKNGNTPALKVTVPLNQLWKNTSTVAPDFRFTNLLSFSDRELKQWMKSAQTDEHFYYVFTQWLSMHDFDSFPTEDLKLLAYIQEKKDLQSLFQLFAKNKVKRISKNAGTEIRDLFFLA